MRETIQMIIIDARRWFDRTYGNTYHSVTVTVKESGKDDVILNSGVHYGYGNHYLQTAHAQLQAAGIFPVTDTYKDYAGFLEEMRTVRTKFYTTVHDVKRKKDL